MTRQAVCNWNLRGSPCVHLADEDSAHTLCGKSVNVQWSWEKTDDLFFAQQASPAGVPPACAVCAAIERIERGGQ